MFKIGEFSKLTQVSIRMLRYYDEMNVLPPAVIDTQNGYRLYTAGQILTLNKILFLKEIGFSTKEMAELLNDWNNDSFMEELQGMENRIEINIAREKQKLQYLKKAYSDIQNGDTEKTYTVKIKAIPAYPVIALREITPNYFSESKLWEKLSKTIKDNQWPIKDTNEGFSISHDMDYKENDVDVEVCIVTDYKSDMPSNAHFMITEPIEFAACFMVCGSYENIKPSYLSLANWLENHKEYSMLGTSRQVALKGPWNEKNPQKYLTEIQIPIMKNKS